MGLTVSMVTFDTHDARALADWWASHSGGEVQAHDDEFVMVLPASPGQPALGFQRVDDPTPGKNRVHVDLGVDDPAAWVERFVASGASKVAEHAMDDGFAWTVLTDPHGNHFCVSPAHPG
ncbi:VOC family protein [Cellulomonas wangsupingiae]|uniref:VOC family protein n=1 Tax=Cellulomonas wangsupingiae TaxID=2968085 RepID=A0ABY5K1V5_9CELL|nr:VOC family protein [Cellulomonas wangsupingiae]MCC2333589.1 VOC family protein [Cellulomonas wangsupingiae]MCM0641518.1 VOC family protein [Cellulomonas wangsupingiae]UUI63768.1 VOC family protein [Cellulomonas wangsupingiae]